MIFNRFAKYTWAVLSYNLLVIVWGAYVRASGSGAGCGSHWPLCNGEMIPRSPQMKTIVELTHRVTSGLALIAVIVLMIWAFRAYPRKHAVRYGALASLFFILTEALIGAGLVLLEYVALNASIARAYWMSGHLINTFLLLASLVLTAWWASSVRQSNLRGQVGVNWALAFGLLGMIVLGVSGAVAALGDTLFPAGSLAEGIKQDFSSTAHALIRLRLWHPIIAVAVSSGLIVLAIFVRKCRSSAQIRMLSSLLIAIVLVQLAAGVVNLLLLAPIWMQLVHLLLSDLIWITLVVLAIMIWSDNENELDERNPLPQSSGVALSKPLAKAEHTRA